jgi:hypothetical protein
VDPLSATCNSGALNAMFLATNYEDGDAMSQREQEENNDNALMRFEWIEILVRVAIAKFIQDKRMTEDISTAMEYLCRYHLDTMPAEATLDVNVFRRTRFYSEEMDLLLRVRGRNAVQSIECLILCLVWQLVHIFSDIINTGIYVLRRYLSCNGDYI